MVYIWWITKNANAILLHPGSTNSSLSTSCRR
jgi:hypothetical protein